jgi:F0F1-type ATP synthase alpha subunit
MNILKEKDALKYTVIVAATASNVKLQLNNNFVLK